MLQVKLNGADISSSVIWETLALTDVLSKEVNRLEFKIYKTPSSTVPNVGDTIEFYENGSKLFGGILVERNETVAGRMLSYECKCKDWSAKLDGKVVTKNYANMDPHDIVLDIVNHFTTGFTTAHVQTAGFNVESIKFNYEQVTRSLTQLADQIGWDWYVDPDRDIHFFSVETNSAPFELHDDNGTYEWNTLELNQTIVNLKNHVYVRGGDHTKNFCDPVNDLTCTDPANKSPDVYKADGVRTTFQLSYEYATITVVDNGLAQTVGVDQKDDPSDFQVLYNQSEKIIKFTTAPTNGHTIVAYGDALIPIIASVRDQQSIATYGEFEQAVVDKSILSVAEAQSRAKAEMRKFGENVHEGRFKTLQTGLRTGQSLTIKSSIRPDIENAYKIQRITGKARGSDHMEYEVFLLASGEVTFTDIMVGLLGQPLKNVDIGSNEVLERLEDFNEGISLAEAISASSGIAPYTWGSGGSNDFRWDFATWS